MKVLDYLKNLNDLQDVTFIKVKAREDKAAPYFHPEYQETPIWAAGVWMKPGHEKIQKCTILNDRQMPIEWLSGSRWSNAVQSGSLKCLLVISDEDFSALYPDAQQRAGMVRFIDKQLEA